MGQGPEMEDRHALSVVGKPGGGDSVRARQPTVSVRHFDGGPTIIQIR